ncbi:helix-turn-helix domain-containing protein [Belliella marina]|uniref:Helix-turn-helix domain-containing protein n=1 Tax=Belliella marina TaxID=1644146 RepID=A0ABW4VUR2_9BACT
MKVTDIKSCYIGPEISPEQFIAEHFFLYLAKGKINSYDGNKKQTIHADEYCLFFKNHLARYNKEKTENEFEKVVIIFDEAFLKKFQEKHRPTVIKFKSEKAFLKLDKREWLPNFIQSLVPYYNRSGKIDKAFADIKREELLVILLKNQPELVGIFFDYGIPEKINLEAFMNKNFKFNVSIQRLAYMTGRSLSAFKRDFKEIFNEAPNRWLIQKRLQEAHFLIDKKNKKPTDIYLELGFEDLSHFSYAFKKQFGYAPTELSNK